MTAFAQWLASSPLATAARVFVATVLAMAVADWTKVGAIDFANWQPWVIAAATSALPVVVNWLNPAYTSYGKGAPSAGDIHDVFGTED